ncbi:substrate-binding domain-containing protein [Psychroflexus salis]|uniref:ABC transporter substrate-binding protein n=1 Tax=Psychroflexus salis TaxID=1526574 RepID=A0A917E7U3_9FLAO|nr:substrate-binding domain-containing protein [Psychroflexus salis]GGE09301.1 ABC transporter substrate-binding protein [Psychroflexus salis]
MQTIKIGGVPEHFNYPWHQAIKKGAFKAVGIDLQWQDFPGGTGEMSDALAKQEIDLAIMLTEGSVKKICDGLDLRIVQKYVDSPLLWGIYVKYNSEIETIEELENKTAAISREGSGSHLMAYVNAKNENWDTQNLNFQIAHHLDGAVEAIQQNEADYFMWEHFTTKPLVDNKIFKHINDCPTPWPCFVIVAENKFIKKNTSAIKNILNTINKQTQANANNKNLAQEISEAYRLKLIDVQKWLSQTRWSQAQISSTEIKTTLHELESLDLVEINGGENFF